MNFVRERSAERRRELIDATFAMAKGGGAEVGPSKRGKGIESCDRPRGRAFK
jgi:hypothetical protein